MDTGDSDESRSSDLNEGMLRDRRSSNQDKTNHASRTPQRGKGGLDSGDTSKHARSRKAAEPHSKEIDLHRLTSISGGSGGNKRKSYPPANGNGRRDPKNGSKKFKR